MKEEFFDKVDFDKIIQNFPACNELKAQNKQILYGPRCEKTSLRGLQTTKAQTRLVQYS